MPRITITTPVPVGTDLAEARTAARAAAIAQFPIQIVEETLLPTAAIEGSTDTLSNDSSVDRTLVTTWDLIN